MRYFVGNGAFELNFPVYKCLFVWYDRKKRGNDMKTPTLIDAQNFATDQIFFFDDMMLRMDFLLHRHSFVEMEYIVCGGGENIVNGKKYELKRGAISLLMPWHVHELYADRIDPPRIKKCSFRIDMLDNGNALLKSVSSMIMNGGDYSPVVYFTEDESKCFEEVFDKALQENKSADAYKTELCSALTTEMVIMFLKKATANTPEREFSVWDILKTIETSFNKKDTTLENIAAKYGYSPSHVAKLLKEQIGMSFSEILDDVRIRNAQYMLIYTDASIEDIATSVGYKTKSGLYNMFVKLKGISPTMFRNENKKPTAPKDTLQYSYANAKIIYYLHKHYAEDITLEDVAEEFHYNKTYLSQLLSSDGTSFSDLIGEIRVYNACKLLKTTDLSVEEVAVETGFKSNETFYRTFKKCRRMTPNEYRKTVK